MFNFFGLFGEKKEADTLKQGIINANFSTIISFLREISESEINEESLAKINQAREALKPVYLMLKEKNYKDAKAKCRQALTALEGIYGLDEKNQEKLEGIKSNLKYIINNI